MDTFNLCKDINLWAKTGMFVARVFGKRYNSLSLAISIFIFVSIFMVKFTNFNAMYFYYLHQPLYYIVLANSMGLCNESFMDITILH